jgi:assimilatory nitrate reductase catalytic subunit
VESAQLPWRLVAFGSAIDVSALMNLLDPLMNAAPYAVRTLIGRERPGVRLALAAEIPLAPDGLEDIDRAFGLHGAEAVSYEDRKRGIARRIALEGDAIRAVRLSGGILSEPWLRDLWQRAATVTSLRSYLLSPIAMPPGAPAPRGRTVCNCFDVAESDIDAFLSTSNSMQALQASLKCGTSCGSCLPELRRRVAA